MKEWIDANDSGAAVIPFSGILENKLVNMSPEDRKAFLEENKTQR
jgi:obg-like ATPase 1